MVSATVEQAPAQTKRLTIHEAQAITVRRLRFKSGYSLRELSKRSHVALSFLSEIEAANKQPSLTTLEAIANGLDIHTVLFLKEVAITINRGY